ncbi:uncharacterized protein [Gossypium hirsutum]|uniref:RNase H type-1 domain-containing protein n=1 Tax=Gossypium hirsutum TaxID=3635 RepID=A0ABM2YNN6_GOSHI|nr:uncharacterized protein LOC121206043 [Gossypium hirsutum]
MWYRRNQLIHEGAKFSLQEVIRFIRGYVQEVNLYKEKLGGFDGFLKKEYWKPPDLGFIKINFDATFQSDSRTSTIAVLARDSRGEIRGAVTYLIEDVANAFIAEARACERSLLFVQQMGFQCLIVEGDSLTVIKKLQARVDNKSILRPIIHHIRELEHYFEKVVYLFVSRAVNEAAHTLAVEGRRSQRFGFWVDGVPASVKRVLERDWRIWLQTNQIFFTEKEAGFGWYFVGALFCLKARVGFVFGLVVF